MKQAESGKSVPSERNKTISPFVTESKVSVLKLLNARFVFYDSYLLNFLSWTLKK